MRIEGERRIMAFLGGDFCAKGITRAFCEFKGMYMVQWFSKGKPDYRLPKKLVHG